MHLSRSLCARQRSIGVRLAPLALIALAGVLLHGRASLVSAVHAAAQTAAPPQVPQKSQAEKMAFYQNSVKPILQTNCYRCHSGMNHRGGFSMATRTLLLKGGHDGAVVIPGDPDKSLLIALINHHGPKDDPMPMPPKSKLSDAEIATIHQWIADGAVMDSQ